MKGYCNSLSVISANAFGMNMFAAGHFLLSDNMLKFGHQDNIN